MSQAAVAAHNARNACHARGVASLRTAVGVAGARAVVCDTAGAVIAGLSTGAADGVIVAELIVRAARSTETGSASGAPYSAPANTSVIGAAGVAMRAITVGATLVAAAIAAVLARSAAARRSGTRAEATRISDATYSRGLRVRTSNA